MKPLRTVYVVETAAAALYNGPCPVHVGPRYAASTARKVGALCTLYMQQERESQSSQVDTFRQCGQSLVGRAGSSLEIRDRLRLLVDGRSTM